jgi:hypothetical protein
MPAQTTQKVDKIKAIDQMLEDFAGDEYDDYQDNYGEVNKSHKHYSADEDATLDIDDLY